MRHGTYCALCLPRNGSTRQWRKTRQSVLERDGYRCQLPIPDGRVCGRPATQVDHRVPVIDGGSDELSNLRAACAPCNARKGASTERTVP